MRNKQESAHDSQPDVTADNHPINTSAKLPSCQQLGRMEGKPGMAQDTVWLAAHRARLRCAGSTPACMHTEVARDYPAQSVLSCSLSACHHHQLHSLNSLFIHYFPFLPAFIFLPLILSSLSIHPIIPSSPISRSPARTSPQTVGHGRARVLRPPLLPRPPPFKSFLVLPVSAQKFPYIMVGAACGAPGGDGGRTGPPHPLACVLQ